FLGDAALGLIVAQALFQHFPNYKEGELSRLRSSLVNGEALAKLAQEFSLSNYIRLGTGEKRSGGAYRKSILADAMEAIIGAIYLDQGYQVCCQVVNHWYGDRLQRLSVKNLKDAKTQLQEYLQARHYPLPNYQIVKIEGEAHAQTFFIACQVEGLALVSEGKGTSRRKAEQKAAENYLQLLKNDE
ncbi:MAG: ribonuclease III, partial [Pseudomonadota bacterium]